jgi:hypothetical protein
MIPKPSTRPPNSRSIASIVIFMSVAFLPLVMSNCWCGSMACRWVISAQPFSADLLQLP